MRTLCWQVIIPMTIILFVSISKWWYVLPIDAPHTMMKGFPLPYEAEAWHTSLAKQYFLLEFTADLLVYALFVTICVFVLHKVTKLSNTHWIVWVSHCVGAFISISWISLEVAWLDNIYYLKRDFDYEVQQTGWYLEWTGIERPPPEMK